MLNRVESSVIFDENNWEELHLFLKEYSYSKYFVLVDKNTHLHCFSLIKELLDKLEISFIILEVAAGEQSKNIITSSYLWGELTENKADRKSLLINLGGGVVTDLGGFVAATYKRGIDFINIPTSLLAMVDASAGGKCGIDFQHYKNQIGVFKEAKRTVINPVFLNTLPKEELKSGFAEVIKHALIADNEYFEQIKEIKQLEEFIDVGILQRSIKIKEAIVERDPFEKNERKKLNFGHTIGHAIESFFFEKENALPHGFAVAAGMLCESYLSNRLLALTIEDHNQIEQLIRDLYDLPMITLDELDSILEYISQDKKNEGHRTQFTLLENIGSASINHEVSEDLIRECLEYYCENL